MKTKKSQTAKYMVHVWGDVDPLLLGPYADNKARNKAAGQVEHSSGDFPDMLFKLDIPSKGKPRIAAWSGKEMDEIRAMAEATES